MICNIAAYQFATLTELKPLRERLLVQCREWQLKGTILLSLEGINLFVAGAPEGVGRLLELLRTIPGLADLTPKFSESDHQPFNRMLVRIKKEIIAFGVEGINPAQRTSPKLSAQTLKQWLDEGRPLILLDTRNDYEIKLGTFKNALPIGVNHFRQFPEAVQRLPEAIKDQPVVMFCTGGIRCEKAGPFMEREGFREIFQLDGGILKYFEECGGAHYDGECFVFDQRVGVDPALHETDSSQCFNCKTPLTPTDLRSPHYVPDQSCSYCYKPPMEAMTEIIARRHEAIRLASTPLPGSQPYNNYRPINVPASMEGRTVIDFLNHVFAYSEPDFWAGLIAEGKVLDAQYCPAMAGQIVRAGERFYRLMLATIEPEVNSAIEILHEDDAIIVLHKPAPLPMHPGGRFNRNTLQFFLNAAYHPQKPRAAHRLDANTTGLVVCSRIRHFAKSLQSQFARGEVEKIYLVRVQGCPQDDVFSCEAPISAEPGALGAREVDEATGLTARTDFFVRQRFADGTTLIEARPLTGRTNQIRVHLWQLGLPVCGDQVYLKEQRMGETQTLDPNDPPLCLHALCLTLNHPLTKERVTFKTKKPEWAVESSVNTAFYAGQQAESCFSVNVKESDSLSIGL